MIVRLIRPEEPGGPWLLYAPGGVHGFIEPSPELARSMETHSGYFEAEPLAGGGWDIRERTSEQSW